MGRKVQVFGERKDLAECTQQDIEALSRGAEPASVIKGSGEVTKEGVYARLLKEMQDGDAETVGALGDETVSRWETALGEQYTSASDVLFGGLGKPAKGADDDAAS